MSTRILLVDDHKIFREGLKAMLDKQPDIEVIGEADNGRVSLGMVKELLPDIVIMDVVMPEMNGIDATREIIRETPQIKIIGLSMQADMRYVTEMLKAGASAFLLKDCDFKELLQAINAVRENRIYLSPGINESMIRDYINVLSMPPPPSRSALTARERQVLQLMAEGKSMRDIAAHLGLSVKTAEAHRLNIMEKLGIRSMAELIKYAIREGLATL
jgi:two-component system, NarL family, response regulator NreC